MGVGDELGLGPVEPCTAAVANGTSATAGGPTGRIPAWPKTDGGSGMLGGYTEACRIAL